MKVTDIDAELLAHPLGIPRHDLQQRVRAFAEQRGRIGVPGKRDFQSLAKLHLLVHHVVVGSSGAHGEAGLAFEDEVQNAAFALDVIFIDIVSIARSQELRRAIDGWRGSSCRCQIDRRW